MDTLYWALGSGGNWIHSSILISCNNLIDEYPFPCTLQYIGDDKADSPVVPSLPPPHLDNHTRFPPTSPSESCQSQVIAKCQKASLWGWFGASCCTIINETIELARSGSPSTIIVPGDKVRAWLARKTQTDNLSISLLRTHSEPQP